MILCCAQTKVPLYNAWRLLKLAPSSPLLSWTVISEMAGIQCSQMSFRYNSRNYQHISAVWTRLSERNSEISIYPAVDGCSLKLWGQSKRMYTEQFHVLNLKRKGPEYSVDFACGIVSVCAVKKLSHYYLGISFTDGCGYKANDSDSPL